MVVFFMLNAPFTSKASRVSNYQGWLLSRCLVSVFFFQRAKQVAWRYINRRRLSTHQKLKKKNEKLYVADCKHACTLDHLAPHGNNLITCFAPAKLQQPNSS